MTRIDVVNDPVVMEVFVDHEQVYPDHTLVQVAENTPTIVHNMDGTTTSIDNGMVYTSVTFTFGTVKKKYTNPEFNVWNSAEAYLAQAPYEIEELP